VLAEVVRSGFVEGRHRGSVVVLSPSGHVRLDLGDTTTAVLPRSCNKPLQAVAMVRLGLDLPSDLLALACASHSGEGFHAKGVRRILAGAGLTESALRTPPDWPLDETAREAAIRSGAVRSPVLMNCSGKHAAMLATCVLNGWDVGTYTDRDHPLQVAIAASFAELIGAPIVAVGVDGCGAPLFSASLRELAGAFGRVATAPPATPEGLVAAAIRQHPAHVSGTTRDEARLLRGLPGAIAKAGAEACYALAMRDGTAIALKVEDGAARARPVVMAAVLRVLGIDNPVVDELAATPVLGGGAAVGEIRAALAVDG